MVIKDGRFGPYVTDGETNASLRKGDDVETLTVERAAELLADRRARGPAPKRTRRRRLRPRRDTRQGRGRKVASQPPAKASGAASPVGSPAARRAAARQGATLDALGNPPRRIVGVPAYDLGMTAAFDGRAGDRPMVHRRAQRVRRHGGPVRRRCPCSMSIRTRCRRPCPTIWSRCRAARRPPPVTLGPVASTPGHRRPPVGARPTAAAAAARGQPQRAVTRQAAAAAGCPADAAAAPAQRAPARLPADQPGRVPPAPPPATRGALDQAARRPHAGQPAQTRSAPSVRPTSPQVRQPGQVRAAVAPRGVGHQQPAPPAGYRPQSAPRHDQYVPAPAPARGVAATPARGQPAAPARSRRHDAADPRPGAANAGPQNRASERRSRCSSSSWSIAVRHRARASESSLLTELFQR